MVDVLALHGSPGAGKSTRARALWEALRAADRAAGLIDIDELTLVVPYPGRQFAFDNLAAIWPHYLAVPGIRLIIPTVFADERERSAEWRQRLREFVDLYASRKDHARVRDLTVSTHPADTAETTQQILQRLGWAD